MKRTLSFLASAALMTSPTWADLNFKTKRAIYEAKPTDESFETVFKFKNTGKHPVVVKKVDSNCGCISAITDKDRYERGESGTVTATFKIGSAEGIQTKSVSVVYVEELSVVKPKIVQTVDPDDPLVVTPTQQPARAEPIAPIVAPTKTDRLTVELSVPTIVNIDPKITKWTLGDPSQTKTILVTMDYQDPITIKDIRSSRDNVKVEMKEIEAGKKYELSLTPTSTDKIQLGMLTIETDCSIKKHHKKLAFFSIQRAEENPPPKAAPPAPKAADDEAAPEDAGKPVNGEAVEASATAANEEPSS
ncbi:MAG: hypothetical protein ACI8T1_001755 [Verrucomicrobiales bacterium]|jgi:hypothetical protein